MAGRRFGDCELPFGKQSISVKWPTSDPEGRARFQRTFAIVRIDVILIASEPMDMRARAATALAKVIAVFGAATLHCAYLFAHCSATRV